MTCQSTNVMHGFKNVAMVTGAPPTGANVTASSSATVTVLRPPPGITTSQSLTPNDEGFVLNGQGATGTMTFKLFPPTDPHLLRHAGVQADRSGDRRARRDDQHAFRRSSPGTWRWVVIYSGDSTHRRPRAAAAWRASP